MPAQDTSQIKEKIVFTIRRRGPCLPVHIASEIQTSILFASAFLSELVSEKKIRMSYMRVGNSPLYFIPGQEYLLEEFSQHLRSKEKDAFNLLKEKRFLVDSKQEPAIRVALRSIKDFAIPFKEGEEIIWKYHTEKKPAPRLPKSKMVIKKPLKVSSTIDKTTRVEVSDFARKGKDMDEQSHELGGEEGGQQQLDIFGDEEKPVKKPIRKAPIKKTVRKVTASQKKNEKFFNKVKEFLAEKAIEISDIEGFSKSDLILKVTDGGVEKLLIAYNKKRITEADLLKAYKKASEYDLPYIILSLGDLPKKLGNLIEALRKLSGIDKLE